MSFQCGYVSIIGQPNVGKSTLLNKLIAQKISITSRKPHTTRSTLLGIKSDAQAQIIYLDTPGLTKISSKQLPAEMQQVISEADVLVLVITACRWQAADADLMSQLQGQTQPMILAVNKIDRLTDKTRLLPFLNDMRTYFPFASIIPLSARSGKNISALVNEIKQHLPQHPAYFAADQLTDQDDRVLSAEFIREKIMRLLGDELPYALSVSIEKYQQYAEHLHIDATIWVDNKGQKKITIGQGGERLKLIGSQARHDIERLLQQRIYLGLWVKVRKNNTRPISKLGTP